MYALTISTVALVQLRRLSKLMKPNAVNAAWEILGHNVIYKNDPWIELSVETVRTDKGCVVPNYHQLTLPDFVVVVAETQDNRVLCLRQYKHGLGKVSLTFPGGIVEVGEAPDSAVQRELLEETGYKATSWSHLGSFTVNGNLGAGRGHFYSAQGAHPFRPPASGDLEQMSLELKTWTELSQCTASGEIMLLNHITALSMAAPKSFVLNSGAFRAVE